VRQRSRVARARSPSQQSRQELAGPKASASGKEPEERPHSPRRRRKSPSLRLAAHGTPPSPCCDSPPAALRACGGPVTGPLGENGPGGFHPSTHGRFEGKPVPHCEGPEKGPASIHSPSLGPLPWLALGCCQPSFPCLRWYRVCREHIWATLRRHQCRALTGGFSRSLSDTPPATSSLRDGGGLEVGCLRALGPHAGRNIASHGALPGRATSSPPSGPRPTPRLRWRLNRGTPGNRQLISFPVDA
jgi:hypothetical protein